MAMFSGPDAVAVYAISALASGLRLYAKTGLKPARAYTPTNMLRQATAYTGQTFKRGQYLEAAAALEALARQKAAALPPGAIEA